jgi:TRAP-type mannitol/chloroaromatic compound transport system permease small subunit
LSAARRAFQLLDRALGLIIRAARWLVLPLIALLFLQWPLRDGLHRFSREANDIGQIVFALFIAVAITAATRAQAHLSTDILARRYSARVASVFRRAAALLALLPWGAFICFAGFAPLKQSLSLLEAFQDTLNPGYFLIKASAALLAALVVAQALLTLTDARDDAS